jgi:hypothetical protein
VLPTTVDALNEPPLALHRDAERTSGQTTAWHYFWLIGANVKLGIAALAPTGDGLLMWITDLRVALLRSNYRLRCMWWTALEQVNRIPSHVGWRDVA